MAIKASNQVSLLDITDAYSVTLTSETYTFMGDTSGAPSGLTCTTQVLAYCGANQCLEVNVLDVTCPTGISATISNNGTSSPTITFRTTSVITDSCEATISVEVDGVTVNKKFSFAVAKQGDIPEDVVTKGELVEELNSELKIDGNCISLTTGNFTINSKNLTLDSSGNATFSGTITGASGEFTKSFYVNVPHPISQNNYDDSAWRISCNDTSMFLGLYVSDEIAEEPAFNNSRANIEISEGSISIHSGSLFLYSGNGDIRMDYFGNEFTINSNAGSKIALSNKAYITGDMVVSNYLNAKRIISNTDIVSCGMELIHPTPFIDFHYNNSSADYVARLINDKSDRLHLVGTHFYADGEVSASRFLQNGRGSAMCGHNLEHTYYCHWTGSYTLDFQVDTTWVWSTSDKRLKKNITSINDDYVDAIGQVDLIQYNLNREGYSDKELYFGAIAQDVVGQLEDKGFTDAGLKLLRKQKATDDDDTLYYGMDYEQFLILRLAYDEKIIKNMQKKIDALMAG